MMRACLTALVLGAARAVDAEPSCVTEGSCDSASLLQRMPVQRHEQVQAKARAVPGGVDFLQAGAYKKHYTNNVAFQDDLPTCKLSSKSNCALTKMKGPTLVYPGGETRCLNGDEYGFVVTPGRKDKLMLLFEGGGACWESNGAFGKLVIEQCTPSMVGALGISGVGAGIQDVSNPENPFKDYTIVNMLYCSGDAFAGNTTMTSQQSGQTLIQHGAYNAKAALTWARANTVPELKQLTVVGFSAGSLGLMSWADYIFSTFKYKSGSAIADSYVGQFPAGTQAYILQRWGACSTVVEPEFLDACLAGEVTVQDGFNRAIREHPAVTFSSIQSKVDASQIWFYQGVAQSWGMQADMAITDAEFYAATLPIIEKWNVHPNYFVYLVNGGQHCFVDSALFYSAGAAGANEQAAGVPSLVSWTEEVRDHDAKSYCDGPVSTQPLSASDTTWCLESLLQKDA